MFPKGWSKIPLSELGNTYGGLTGKSGVDFGTGSKFIPYTNIFKNGRIDVNHFSLVQIGRDERQNKAKFGDIFFTGSSETANEVGMTSVLLDDVEDLYLNSFCFGYRLSDFKKLVPKYAVYALRSSEVRADMTKLAQGSTRFNISKAGVLQIEVKLPPISEQLRIAEILSSWDRAIEVTTKLLANSRKQWQALIGATLHLPSANPDSDTPADNGGFPQSVQPGIPTLPPVPTGWRRVHLGDHLHEVRRPVALVDDSRYTLVTVKRSRGGVLQRAVLLGSEVKTPTQFFVQADDFLISKRQIVHGACGLVPQELHGAVVSNEYAVLNSDGEIDLRFLRYLSETRYFQQTCFHSSIGVHVEKMIFKTERWFAWPINIPPIAEQQRIAEILDIASLEVISIANQLDALKREKIALMDQLLTGKRRVKTIDYLAGDMV